MSAHPTELLPLAAAGVLDAVDEQRLAAHLAECPACAGEAEAWRLMVQELGRLPAPRAPRDLVVRTRQAVEQQLAERADRAWNRAALGFLVGFAWTLAIVVWLALDLVTGGLAVWLARPVGSTVAWYVAYVVAGWLTGGAAAVLLGRNQKEERIV